MMFKQFLFYDIEIYFILYHAFFILSDDSLSSTLYRKKPSNDDFSEGAKNLSLLYFKHLNVFFKQFIKETVCIFKKGFEYFGF